MVVTVLPVLPVVVVVLVRVLGVVMVLVFKLVPLRVSGVESLVCRLLFPVSSVWDWDWDWN